MKPRHRQARCQAACDFFSYYVFGLHLHTIHWVNPNVLVLLSFCGQDLWSENNTRRERRQAVCQSTFIFFGLHIYIIYYISGENNVLVFLFFYA